MRRSSLALIPVLALAGCGGSRAGASDASNGGPTAGLVRCADAWNHASLGPGRLQLGGVAGNGAPALVVRFSDGVCGLVPSPGRAQATGDFGAYVTVLSGDYVWGEDPAAVGTGPPTEQLAALEELAARRPNATIEGSRGRVVPVAAARLTAVAFPEASPAATRAPCRTIADLQTSSAFVVEQGAGSCALTRELVWAYDDGEGRLLAPARAGFRMIAGWRCGTATRPQVYPNLPLAIVITCTRGPRVIEVRLLSPGT